MAQRDKANTQPGATSPEMEKRILEATVGAPKVLNSTIHLAAPDPIWPLVFAREARAIREVLGDGVVLLEHVGSTSVPGLMAKPIIDMLLVVADAGDERSYVPPLEERGYVLRIREPDWFQHRLLNPPNIKGNLHVFSDGCEEVRRMLIFRDWLRSNVDDRRRYEDAKRELARRVWKYTQCYADAKSKVIGEIMTRALGSQP